MKNALWFVLLACVVTSFAQGQVAPVIIAQSSSATRTQGQAVLLEVDVNGTTPFTYLWSKDGEAIPDATGPTLAINSLQVADTGVYRVTVTNSAGTDTSIDMILDVSPAAAPYFYYQPSNVIVTAGDSLWLSPSIGGTSPFEFVWKRGDTVLTTTAQSHFSISQVQLSDAGTYTLTVTNASGVSITSAPIIVTVNPLSAPTFSSHPANASIYLGETLWLWSSASGGEITYQWYKDEIAITGATSSSYQKSNFSEADVGSYRVKATNAAGATSSNTAAVTLRPIEAPTSAYLYNSYLTVLLGNSFNLGVSANGTSPLSFQWLKDGSAIPGAENAGFSKSQAAPSDAGIYSVVVSNSAGSVTSNSVSMAVILPRPTVITSHPASRTIYPGDSVQFSVGLSGDMSALFQWKRDGVAISGANSSTYYLPSPAIAGIYTVEVYTNEGTLVSEPAVLTVQPATAPVITVQPIDQALNPGESVELRVQASGRPTPTYQWKRDGTPIPGATNSTLGINRVASSDAGTYSVDVTNSAGSITSREAQLDVSAGSAPVIVAHPASLSLLAGEYVNLYVGVLSAELATVQWYLNDEPISGATSLDYYFSAQPAKAGTYKAVVTNWAGATTSNEATVTVDLSSNRPVIVRTPGGRSIIGGNTAYIDLALAPGTTPTAIVWKKDGEIVPNAVNSTLTLQNFGSSWAGSYSAEITTAGGTVVSAPIALSLLHAGSAPVITKHPASQTHSPNDSASLQVQVTGEAPFTFEWLKNGAPIPQATQQTYYLPGLSPALAGDYSVKVTNANGTVTSAVATVAVSSPVSLGAPVLLRHPASRNAWIGDGSVELSVSVENSGGVTFEWYKDDVLIPNATSYYYYISAPSTAQVARYKVIARRGGSATTSREATVSFAQRPEPPVFSLQPAHTTGYIGGNISLEAEANGGTVTYQWRKDGADIPGATDSSLELESLEATDAGIYSVIASNALGHVSSSLASLTLEEPTAPVFTQQPDSQYAVFGSSVTLTAAATGVPDPTFQWRRDGTELTGATEASLTLNNLTPSDAGTYTVVASNPGGSVTSSDAVLQLFTTLPTAPAITDQPDDLEGGVGSPATFVVQVTGTDPLSFQWYKDGTAISGETEATLILDFLLPSDAGEYHVVATNPYGSAESTRATLTVTGQKKMFFGTLSTGESWALQVHEDGTATFLGYLEGTNQIIFVQGIVIAADGSFSFGGANLPQSGMRKPLALPVQTAALAEQYFGGQITGQIVGGSLTGQIAGSDVALSGTATESTGLDTVAGIYDAVPLGTNVGEIHAMVAPNGSVLLVEVNADGVRAGVGTVDGSGAFSIEQPEFEYSGTLSTTNQSISGSYIPAEGTPVIIAPTPSAGTGAERLSAVSTRSFAGTDANTLIAGFVISGSAQKDILLRAVGPTLSGMGVTGALADPRLVLYRGQTMIRENDNWSTEANGGSEAAEAAARLGDFALPNGSADAAMLARLDPGVYTAHVTSTAGATGVALLEVYDASPAAADAPKVLALSTRGSVSAGDGVLIVGFVIEGAVPKKVLVRGVGPSLASNVSGALTDPQLQLFKGSTVIAQNDDWPSGSDAAEIETATASSGASPLTSGSKDSALLVYLAPGAYTAHISGVGGATGVALAEIYEVP